MAAESEPSANNQAGIPTDLKSSSSPTPSNQISSSTVLATKPTFGHIRLDISNSVLPLDKLSPTPSGKDGLSEEVEMQIRSFGCELIQLAGKLLKLPQVAMATGCILFQRFFYAKSLIRIKFDEVAMASICLACKIEEAPRRIRDIINVIAHIKQVRAGNIILPVVLDKNYINLKNEVIKAERRVLKELGFCVHVKHPHKIIVMYLKWLELDSHRELLQMSWNFMNDSLRTDVFVRYLPETIAVACIYLSARKLKEPLPKNPSWFNVLGVEEDDIKDCCYRMICLYNHKKANQDELESTIESLRKKMDEERQALREQNFSSANTPSQSSPASRAGSPTTQDSRSQDEKEPQNGGGLHSKEMSESSPIVRHSHKKKHKHKRSRTRSRSRSYDDGRGEYRRDHRSLDKRSKSKRNSPPRSPSGTPPKKRKHSHGHHKDKIRHRSRSRDQDQRDYGGRGGRGGVAAVGVNDPIHGGGGGGGGKYRDRDSGGRSGNGYDRDRSKSRSNNDHYSSRR